VIFQEKIEFDSEFRKIGEKGRKRRGSTIDWSQWRGGGGGRSRSRRNVILAGEQGDHKGRRVEEGGRCGADRGLEMEKKTKSKEGLGCRGESGQHSSWICRDV
jgi:hypothetical protein